MTVIANDRRCGSPVTFPQLENRSSLLMSIVLVALLSVFQANAEEADFPVTELSIAQQNEMMQSYCVMCHLDSSNNGGLSLEHFDAATVSPALAAILANKFTTGVPLEEILRPEKELHTLEAIEIGKKAGAPSVMNMAGLPLPSEAEINGFIMAMAVRGQDAEQWHVLQDGAQISADVIRVTPITGSDSTRDLGFRLTLTCDRLNKEGEILLSWSPAPRNGELQAIADGGTPFTYSLDHEEAMANGDSGTSAPSSVVLYGKNRMEKHPQLSLPESSLHFDGLFPVEAIEFSLDDLREEDRSRLEVCFESA